mmetsp:Transcript_21327/g.44511  ORF Transcript_21327/g.44511 Transcript_21327/m.44511 type:complete len:326 (+) Transcript_21327:30-1007(+)
MRTRLILPPLWSIVHVRDRSRFKVYECQANTPLRRSTRPHIGTLHQRNDIHRTTRATGPSRRHIRPNTSRAEQRQLPTRHRLRHQSNLPPRTVRRRHRTRGRIHHRHGQGRQFVRVPPAAQRRLLRLRQSSPGKGPPGAGTVDAPHRHTHHGRHGERDHRRRHLRRCAHQEQDGHCASAAQADARHRRSRQHEIHVGVRREVLGDGRVVPRVGELHRGTLWVASRGQGRESDTEAGVPGFQPHQRHLVVARPGGVRCVPPADGTGSRGRRRGAFEDVPGGERGRDGIRERGGAPVSRDELRRGESGEWGVLDRGISEADIVVVGR